ncbi:MAG: hypothetical protein S4CHLAM2_06580 [Chlamydiales bacterium]|nr:hypothetical protein [Chlamydiales bacterium]
MLKETGYQEKFELLRPWLGRVIETVKKDLRNEHLKVDREFCKRYFLGKNFHRISLEEMAEAYYKDIQGGNTGLGEFITSRWLLKNTDVYGFFEKQLLAISEDFDALDALPEEVATSLLEGSVQTFGPIKTYLFAVLNSVVFPEKLYEDLRNQAENESKKEEEKVVAESLAVMQKRHRRELSALTDRYEKKLSGLQRKYLKDTEGLKEQVSQLQKKLSS